ncbi:YgaP-like transmembrane domain [Cytophaga hutchinsonii]|jgi:uncharacterized membrane protein|uniref:Uncharacterized protein n=1 Tax=Cytophaga hutchinsonii (strain ATCC 33406 / DSM 1761 / CIP 103989 / NBRC 15051 / NCIMB 9469 / D465) TaxID=269798 RepID=A0A6N4SN49_CYTH3|nr:YgaP-like transmembrane domain [Cytophaga hutchinsonii]ABG57703.1 conserved hypothetical protein [Cytophaga hutchinsonii ATCC 33406]SFX03392.1 Uncharacterized membrane protein [Cytophaga hutchinsonii ATCC 33406]
MEKKLTVNVSDTERIASVLAGSYFMYRSLKRQPKNYAAIASAGLLLFRGVTGHCPGYSAAGKKTLPAPVHNIDIETSVIVNRPVDTVYSFWRRLENLPLFMTHLKSVKQKDHNKSDWEAYLPGGIGSIHWEAKIVKDKPGKVIAWSSLENSTIHNAGKVMFEDIGELGTVINVVISYQAPLGVAGEKVLALLTPTFEKMIRKDIVNFKQYIETGKLPTDKEYAENGKSQFE